MRLWYPKIRNTEEYEVPLLGNNINETIVKDLKDKFNEIIPRIPIGMTLPKIKSFNQENKDRLAPSDIIYTNVQKFMGDFSQSIYAYCIKTGKLTGSPKLSTLFIHLSGDAISAACASLFIPGTILSNTSFSRLEGVLESSTEFFFARAFIKSIGIKYITDARTVKGKQEKDYTTFLKQVMDKLKIPNRNIYELYTTIKPCLQYYMFKNNNEIPTLESFINYFVSIGDRDCLRIVGTELSIQTPGPRPSSAKRPGEILESEPNKRSMSAPSQRDLSGSANLAAEFEAAVDFGKSKKTKKFIQSSLEKMRKKGTLGSFKRWCLKHRLISKTGKVTKKCINVAKKSPNLKIRQKAIFAQNIGAFEKKVKNSKKKKIKK
jgi:hypothetical protein